MLANDFRFKKDFKGKSSRNSFLKLITLGMWKSWSSWIANCGCTRLDLPQVRNTVERTKEPTTTMGLPLLSRFVFAYHPVVQGSNLKHTVYALSIYGQIFCFICHWVWEKDENKQNEAGLGPFEKLRVSHRAWGHFKIRKCVSLNVRR